jgi:hypothetical protein
MVKKFKPETWYDKVSGPTIRFHRFFVLKDFDPDWILVFKEIEKHSMAFVISEAKYCFEHKKVKNKKISITMLECEAVSVAHQMIFSSLQTMNNPNPLLDLPGGWSIGDVFKAPYWARDNMFVRVIDISDTPLSVDEFLTINKKIDDQLLQIPNMENVSTKQKSPLLKSESRTIPPFILTSLHCEAANYPQELPCLFVYTGGRISSKGNNFFFTGYECGEHDIVIYLTDSSQKTIKSSWVVKVIK